MAGVVDGERDSERGGGYLRRARVETEVELTEYPYGLAAVAALPHITFGDVTVLVGDNGTGKSTLVEALAIAAGFNPEGGSKNLRFSTYSTHSDLADEITLEFKKRPRWGWFLRAETFYGMASHIHADDDPIGGVRAIFPNLHDKSHGESFLTLIESRMNQNGLYFLDEPESALSFHGQLRLMANMRDALDDGAQFVIATHSPILMSFPGASIYEFDQNGVNRVEFDDVESVVMWRNFLDAPERFHRHLFG